ncbi:MAG: GSCFA family protein [Kordiimonadales bacterium]|nr:MAG: GSCFA family protein [Kordiimonadales bacterium]
MTKSANPYHGLPARSFWRTGVAAHKDRLIDEVYSAKFSISQSDNIATAGSCFAQHIARHMRASGFSVLDTEPAPKGLRGQQFGYNLYSARYGNIYHARQLRLLAEEAYGQFEPTGWVWQSDGAFYDAFRPTVEPQGLPSLDHIGRHRQHHLQKVRQLFSHMDVFVFTLGLTEAWLNQPQQYVVPTAPGVVASPENPDDFVFKNFRHAEIYADLQKFLEVVRAHNPAFKMILTVSPVPLVATAGPDHVLPATVYSKSVLRAAAGDLAADDPNVAYFPSYEIITGAQAGGRYFEPNLRSVTAEGVEHVMRHFFKAHPQPDAPARDGAGAVSTLAPDTSAEGEAEDDDVLCDEILNDAFLKPGGMRGRSDE